MCERKKVFATAVGPFSSDSPCPARPVRAFLRLPLAHGPDARPNPQQGVNVRLVAVAERIQAIDQLRNEGDGVLRRRSAAQSLHVHNPEHDVSLVHRPSVVPGREMFKVEGGQVDQPTTRALSSSTCCSPVRWIPQLAKNETAARTAF